MTDQAVMSDRATKAIERFADEAERSQLERRGDKRIDAARRYAAMRAALSPRELALLEMTALKRRSLAELSNLTGQPVVALAQLLLQAGERLADHFENLKGGRPLPGA